jgi:hypothetical protein
VVGLRPRRDQLVTEATGPCGVIDQCERLWLLVLVLQLVLLLPLVRQLLLPVEKQCHFVLKSKTWLQVCSEGVTFSSKT